jgi:predicted DNA-binding transcriptional regulator YafY
VVRREGDGQVSEVALDVGGMAWFERLLLQLGTDAQVVSPPELTDLAARAAERLLRTYQESEEA